MNVKRLFSARRRYEFGTAPSSPRLWTLLSFGLVLSTLFGCAPESVPASNSGTRVPIAGAGPAAGGGASGATFTQVLEIFKAKNCGICHTNATSGGGFMFNPADKVAAHSAFVGKMSVAAGKCPGKTYVVTGMPNTSLLYQKLTATPGCGVQMPQAMPPLSQAEIATVASWIMAGAQNN